MLASTDNPQTKPATNTVKTGVIYLFITFYHLGRIFDFCLLYPARVVFRIGWDVDFRIWWSIRTTSISYIARSCNSAIDEKQCFRYRVNLFVRGDAIRLEFHRNRVDSLVLPKADLLNSMKSIQQKNSENRDDEPNDKTIRFEFGRDREWFEALSCTSKSL